MRVIFYGGQTAGLIVLLGLAAKKNVRIIRVIPQDDILARASKILNYKTDDIDELDDISYIKRLSRIADVMICCHGRKILKKELTDSIRCINFHPCLYKYKGAFPINKLLENKDTKASVGAHIMTERIDKGPPVKEIFVNLDKKKMNSECEIYNQLYPVYLEVLQKVLVTLRKLF